MSSTQDEVHEKRADVSFGLKEAISLHNDQTTRVDRLGSFYAIVSFGVLTLGVTEKIPATNATLVKSALTFGYVCFLIVNNLAIVRTHTTLSFLSDGIEKMMDEANGLEGYYQKAIKYMRRAPPKVIGFYLLFLDMVVILALWAPNLFINLFK